MLGRLLWPILIAIAVILAVVVSASGEETRVEINYLEELQTHAAELAKDGEGLRDVASRLEQIDRTEFVTVFEGISEDLVLALAFVEDEPPTVALAPVRSFYRQALQAWDAGVGGYASAVLLAADVPESVLVADRMVDALAELRTGDRVYLDLLAAMEREDVPEPLTPMPSVVMMPSAGSLVRLSASYIEAARSPASRLALRPGLAVSQVVADPEWQVNPSDEVVVPATDSIVFSVVVTNVGNSVSGTESLILTLTGGPEQIQMEEEVSSLQPDQQVTIRFEALTVRGGGIYEVAASLAVSGPDANLNDNEIRVQFTVNEG